MTDRLANLPPEERQALRTLSLLSPKWQPVVLLTVGRHAPIGYNDLLEQIPDISSKVLSSTLEDLASADLVERSVVNESPLRVEYALTAAGADLRPALVALGDWGNEYLEDELPSVVLGAVDRRLTEMYANWIADTYDVERVHEVDTLEDTLSGSIDVLVLDERLAGIPAVDALLEHQLAYRSVLVVGDRPDFELFSAGWDEVIRKPIVRETLRETIEEQLQRVGEPAQERRVASIESKRRLLEQAYPEQRLEQEELYQELSETAAEIDSATHSATGR